LNQKSLLIGSFFAIDPAHINKGYGHKLAAFQMDLFKTLDFKLITCFIGSEPSFQILRKFGFVEKYYFPYEDAFEVFEDFKYFNLKGQGLHLTLYETCQT